jgi:oxygen-independent coproporphyrinogen-3 oxidase
MSALYVHVPFCRLRCPYCDFATAPYTTLAAGRFGEAIRREAEAVAPVLGSSRFETLFLGGGTPSRLSPDEFARLLEGLRGALDFAVDLEFTLEANPEDVDGWRLESWQRAGVNRVSLGVQSLQKTELRGLGRGHDVEIALAAMREIADVFKSWSIDLMFGFPRHGMAAWQETLATALSRTPPHLSLYQFTAETGTALGDAMRAGRVSGADEEEMVEMYDAAVEACAAAGLDHYEISNFARSGFRSRHNLAYWKRRSYLGLGPSAVSLWRGRRWRNLSASNRYTDAVLGGASWVQECETLDGKEAIETMMLGLRLSQGVKWSEMPVGGGELRAWQAAASRLAVDGFVTADAAGVRIVAGFRRVADSVILRLWEEMERLREVPASVDTNPGAAIE